MRQVQLAHLHTSPDPRTRSRVSVYPHGVAADTDAVACPRTPTGSGSACVRGAISSGGSESRPN